MTDAQKEWLDEHPAYSPVRRAPAVRLKDWTSEGWLFGSGRFVVDDGDTFFPHAYPAWFPSGDRNAIRVGRHYDIV